LAVGRNYTNESNSNRRLDNRFNIFEGLFQNWFFICINLAMMGAQILIIFVGGRPFSIAETHPPQTGAQWAYAIVLGFISIPVGVIIRLIPDGIVAKLIPSSLMRRSSRLPGLTVSDEERFNYYPDALADVRNELAWLKRVKGGRLRNLKFAMQHPKELITHMRSPSHSRSNSVREGMPPRTPNREDSTGESPAPTPESRARSRSMRSGRSRSNSALGAPTVMAGIIAGSIAAGWSPVTERGNPEFPHHPTPSPLAFTEEPEQIEEAPRTDVPKIKVPEPPSKS
jgi:P-type Ca2+ transporter type 2C